VESTARSGYDYGYNVVLVADAMTDRDADAHRHSVAKIFPRLAEVSTTDDASQALNELLLWGFLGERPGEHRNGKYDPGRLRKT
jgi:hypothetical protein